MSRWVLQEVGWPPKSFHAAACAQEGTGMKGAVGDAPVAAVLCELSYHIRTEKQINGLVQAGIDQIEKGLDLLLDTARAL